MDILKGYNNFHKSVVMTLICIAFLIGLRAFLVWQGGTVQMEKQTSLSVSTADIWPYIIQTEMRDNWVVELIDSAPLNGDASEVNSTRLLFWKRGFDKWHTEETTTQVIKERFYETYIESNLYVANWSIKLTPISECKTQVDYMIVRQDAKFLDRFFSFLHTGDEKKKMARSLQVLEEWTAKKSTCKLQK